MTISLIVAASTNNAIGKDGQLLWHLPNDLKYFKNMTWGMPVIMGRKTFEAVNKILPGRVNIVITRQDGWVADQVIVAKNLDDAIEKAKAANCREIFIIGGGEVYEQGMKMAHRIYMTRVHTVLEGDTYFPSIDESEWALKKQLDFNADDKHPHAYAFQVWEKNND